MPRTIIQIPADSCCSHCGKEVSLSEAERAAGHFVCPACAIPSVATLATSARCAGCNRLLGLDPTERMLGRFRCPYCKDITALPGKEAQPGEPDVLDLVAPPLHDRREDIIVGSVACVAGVALTVVTYFVGGGVFILAWGPIIYGAYRLFRGLGAK